MSSRRFAAVAVKEMINTAPDPLVRQIQSSPLVNVLIPDGNGTSAPIAGPGRSGDA